MNYVVLDLEWNQPRGPWMRVMDPKPLYGEIIQIGAVKIDEKLNELDRFNLMIRPKFYKELKKEIQELTLITEEDLKEGKPFPEAAETFRNWCGEDFRFISWGPEDTKMLTNNMEVYDMDCSWIPDTLDAQLIFDDQFTQEDRSFALNYALWYFEEKPDSAHNALSDVLSTVKVMRHMDMDEAFEDEYFICDYTEYDEED